MFEQHLGRKDWDLLPYINRITAQSADPAEHVQLQTLDKSVLHFWCKYFRLRLICPENAITQVLPVVCSLFQASA